MRSRPRSGAGPRRGRELLLAPEARARVHGRLGHPGRRPRRRLRVPRGVLQRATAALRARLPQPRCFRAALRGEGASSITQVSTESGQAHPLSATAMFCSPVPCGPVEIETEIVRSGKSVTNCQTTLRGTGSGEVGVRLIASFGELLESDLQ